MSHLQNYKVTFTVIACDEDDAIATFGRIIADAISGKPLPPFEVVPEDSITPSTND